MSSGTYKYGHDFDIECASYDNGRIATGVDEMVGMIYGKVKRPLHEIKLLDAGGGSGNYTKEFLKRGIGHVTLLDASKGMLDVASRKMTKEIAEERLEVVQHALPSLPFPDCTFDVVCLIFVIHMLDEVREDGMSSYPNLKASIREVYRVLKPGGAILIVLQSREQSLNSSWYCSLIPKTLGRFKNRYMSPTELQNVLRENGFKQFSAYYRPGEASNVSEEVYGNLLGPFSEEWRKTRTMWGMVEEEELQSALLTLKDLQENGSLKDFYVKNNTFRQDYGQEFNLVAIK